MKELRSLTVASFDLDDDPPTITVEASYSKRRRKDVQPIRQDLANLLREWLAERSRDERPFARLPLQTARMLRLDLDAARATWLNEATTPAERTRREQSDFLLAENAAGEVVDFHALRHTFISGIVAGGASVKVAQELARHSTPVLTIGRYSHARLHDLTGALDALPDVTTVVTTVPQRTALAVTGTDGAAADSWGHLWEQLGGKTGPEAAKRGDDTSHDGEGGTRRNV